MKVFSITSRYILREHVPPFVFGFALITLIFLLNLVFRELGRILSKGLPVGIIAEFFALNLAWIVALAVPMAVLMAVLMAFGRFSSDNEITAFKAGGVSLVRLMRPVLVASVLLALALIWFNNHVLPDANHRLRLLAGDISRKRPTLELQPGVVYRGIPHYALVAQKIVERENVSMAWDVIIDDHSQENVRKTITADSAEIRVDPKTGLLYLTLYNGEIHEVHLDDLSSYRRLKFPRHRITLQIPGMVLVRRESDYRGDREKSASMMLSEVKKYREKIAERREQIKRSAELVARRYMPWLGSQDEKVPSFWSKPDLRQARAQHQQLLGQIETEQAVIRSYRRSINSLMVEVHKKYSIPAACIVFVLVGVPLGVMARHGGMAVGGGIGLLFFLLYWAFLIGGEELADRGYVTPFVAMWSPNFIVGAAGVVLLVRSVRETSFIQWHRIATKLHLAHEDEEAAT
ncbi:MAG: YjgP/YjgQ family permease [Calditrichaeota bacterium]|nr:YjgP/YjgQ family permease [Calditrichota bacterium]